MFPNHAHSPQKIQHDTLAKFYASVPSPTMRSHKSSRSKSAFESFPSHSRDFGCGTGDAASGGLGPETPVGEVVFRRSNPDVARGATDRNLAPHCGQLRKNCHLE